MQQQKLIEAIDQFLNKAQNWIRLNEETGVEAVINQYRNLAKIAWLEYKKELKKILSSQKTRKTLNIKSSKKTEAVDDIDVEGFKTKYRKMFDLPFVALKARLAEIEKEVLEVATSLQFTPEALKELATKLDWQKNLADDIFKTAHQRISDVLDAKYGKIGEYDDVLKSLFGKIKETSVADFKNKLLGYADDLIKEKMDTEAFHSLIKQAIKDDYVKTFIAGREEFKGGELLAKHQKWIDYQIKDEFRYLKGFIDDIESGRTAGGAIELRAGMYGDAIGSVYEKGKVSAFDEPGVKIHWRLGIAEHCWTENTLIDTPEGRIEIKNIIVGDDVLTMEGKKKVIKTYQYLYTGELISLNNTECTPNHPILTERGWIPAGDLIKSDKVMVFQNRKNFVFSPITFSKSDEKSVWVFNLEVEDVHHYIANNVIVHNCPDCIELAEGSPYSYDELPTIPAAGDTVCLSNCACSLVIEGSDGNWEGEI